ncbi:putative lyase [Medicago truncatula]|uniref:(E)-beta-ocimene synthase n=1 Tax=Medicago truncatula TaxID=3880 RepID=Q5UBY0_MEDTR|nr:(-)-germacrene D synthase [Medicago truncatula]AAV36464.1 wound-inducible putative cytosolic terpene synthase 1 [Medicago truncatula]KEH30760.1 sesquiterpene synthase [Medicago truncatula]RHN61945.1 putative lyase [Medicago truncatula]
MSVSVTSSLVAPTPNANSDFSRRSANYHPNIWGDLFIQYVLEPMEFDEIMKQIIMLKEKVRQMLVPNVNVTNPSREANLIDSIQRLGLYHHFEQEIGELLRHIDNNHVENGTITLNEDLHSIALVFRLLRQQGYHILPDVFKKFKNEQGNFKETLVGDVEGMLSLYEATHMRIHGEEILDDALSFTSLHLEMMTTQLSPSVATKINHSLKRPLFKNLPRLVARHYISTYEEDPSHDATLLLLAKLDFNLLQKQHQKEVGDISKWWKDLDFATKLPFARNRIVEAYFWILGVYFEPQYSFGRRIMTKVISLASVIDDIYDVYGTIEELQLFTQAIERWDISCMDFLPQYMKFCYKAVLDVYEEMEQEMVKEGRAFCVFYAKNEMKRLVQAYFTEAKWFSRNYIPTVDEYMALGIVNSGYYLITATSFIGMGCIATEDVFQWLTNNPKIVNASSKIARLMDDIVSNEFEQERGHGASAIECYMNEHGVSREDAVNELSRQVTNAWKDTNEELLDPTEVPKPLLIRVLNLSRVIDVLYKDGDCYTNSQGSTKNDIISILLNPCPV